MEPHQEGSPQTVVFCCSDCEEQSRFHGISTSGSKSVWSSNSWHFCFHASSFQSNGLFSRGWHCHPLWQVPEEKPVLRVEGPCPACGGHHIPVRVRGVLLLGNGALPSEEKEVLLSLPSCFSPYLQPPHDKDRVMKTVPTRQSVQRVTKKEVAPSSPLCHYPQLGGPTVGGPSSLGTDASWPISPGNLDQRKKKDQWESRENWERQGLRQTDKWTLTQAQGKPLRSLCLGLLSIRWPIA